MTPRRLVLAGVVVGVAALLGGVVLLGAVPGLLGSDAPADSDPALRFEPTGNETGFDYRRNPESTYSTTGRAGVFVSDVDGDGYPGLLAIGSEKPVLFRNTAGTIERARRFTPEGTGKIALFFDGDGWDDLL